MAEEENKGMILFFNIGDSDVKIDGNKIPKKEARSKGEEIYKDYDSYKQRLSFELVSPILEKFKEKANKVFLFVTDQSDPKYREQDTLYFGEIIKRFIWEEYKLECEPQHYEWKPVDYNLTFDYFTKFFKEFDDSSTKIISTSGGVPAMNFSIQTVASSLFSNVEFYRVDEETHELKPVPIKDILKKELVKRSAIELLKRHDYGGIMSLLTQNRMGDIKLRRFLRYADSRLCFNLEDANTKLNEFIELLTTSLEKDDYRRKFVINLSDKGTSFNELYQNMHIKWETGEYVDFIARLYRFKGKLLQNIFGEETNSEIDWKDKEAAKNKFTSVLARYAPHLKEVMVKKGIIPDYAKLIEPNDKVLHECFDYFYFQDKGRWERIWKNYPIIFDLTKEFRTYSIDAHGDEGISKKDITRFLQSKGYEPQRLFRELEEIVSHFSKVENKFSEINDVLTEFIAEL